MTQISILGCGWLGLPLAKALLEKRFSVNGSTTSNDKLSVLQNSEIQPFLIVLENNNVSGDIETFLEGSKTLIIDIPPKLRGNSKENFVGKIKILLPYIEKSTIENVLFISSTSVYGGDNSIVTEEAIPRPETESGRQLVQAEQVLQSNTNFKTTILRFGGLIGKDRHPIHFLAGRKNLENSEAPINLIHQIDCIAIIEKIIEKRCWNETFNAVAPFHPTRNDYYTKKAIEMNLVLPYFDLGKKVGKIINSEKLIRVLDFTFQETSL